MKRVADGLVLRVLPTGENDRRLLILTEEGKLWLTAKGAKSTKSRYASLCRVFTYANFEFSERSSAAGTARWITDGSINSDFSGLCRDLLDYSLASYICSLAEELSGEDMPSGDILRMTLNTLYAIEKKLYSREQIKAVYEFYAAAASGFEPDLSRCADCSCDPAENGGRAWLDIMNGAVVCDGCLSKRSGSLPLPDTDAFETRNILLPLDSWALGALRYVLSASPRRIFSFSPAEGESMHMLSRAAEAYLLNHIERDFDTLKFYKSML